MLRRRRPRPTRMLDRMLRRELVARAFRPHSVCWFVDPSVIDLLRSRIWRMGIVLAYPTFTARRPPLRYRRALDPHWGAPMFAHVSTRRRALKLFAFGRSRRDFESWEARWQRSSP